MPEVKGIGGVFINSQDAPRLAKWYEEILGVEMEPHPDGISFFKVFFTRDAESSILRENPVFAINQAKGALPSGDRCFTLNLRVDDLLGFLEGLREKGLEVEEEILKWERGKHAWIHDQDGNRIELYEEILRDS